MVDILIYKEERFDSSRNSKHALNQYFFRLPGRRFVNITEESEQENVSNVI